MRIQAIEESEWDEEIAAAVRTLRPDRSGGPRPDRPWDPARLPANEWADVLARHPRLVHAWSPFNSFAITRGTLPVRPRELAILRVAWRSGCGFAWKTHTVIAPALGLAPADVERVKHGPSADGWADFDRAVLQGVDDLLEGNRVSDRVWASLEAEWGVRQLLEFPALVGAYRTLALTLNSIQADVPQWDDPIA